MNLEVVNNSLKIESTQVSTESLDTYVEDPFYTNMLRLGLLIGALFQIACIGGTLVIPWWKPNVVNTEATAEGEGGEGDAEEEEDEDEADEQPRHEGFFARRFYRLRRAERKKRR